MKLFIPLVCISVLILACNSEYAPKPNAYSRIVLPVKAYTDYNTDCPLTFKYPSYGRIVKDQDLNALPCWFNIDLPTLNGKIHMSYYSIKDKNMFKQLTEDARTLAFKHTIKADDIKQAVINRPEDKVYGIYYRIDGNTASQIQFFATDSVKHYLRGSLYFNSKPNIDSLKPVLDFVKTDIDVLLKTLKWKGISH